MADKGKKPNDWKDIFKKVVPAHSNDPVDKDLYMLRPGLMRFHSKPKNVLVRIICGGCKNEKWVEVADVVQPDNGLSLHKKFRCRQPSCGIFLEIHFEYAGDDEKRKKSGDSEGNAPTSTSTH